jgi:hypothetical protein
MSVSSLHSAYSEHGFNNPSGCPASPVLYPHRTAPDGKFSSSPEDEEEEVTKNILFRTPHATQVARLLQFAFEEGVNALPGALLSVRHCVLCKSYLVLPTSEADACMCTCEEPL